MSTQLEQLKTALVGQYHLERELGRGGMAIVHLAEDLKHHRKVAIKVLHREVATALGPERFLREIDIAASLAHPHVVPLLDSGEAAGSLYYAMPYVSGGSLRQRLTRERQLTVDDAVRIAREVASALDYAHRAGVVHRDVKPENILFADGQAVVTDFGIARAINRVAGDTLTSIGLALGTPAYMSPEQASANPEVDGRSDVYSLGCVLYEMLAGEPPFSGPTAQAVIAKRMSQPAPSVRVVRDGVSAALDRILRRALCRTPADRFPTAAALRRALQMAEEQRLKASVVPSARGATSAQVGMAGKRTRRSQPPRIASIAVLPFENLSRDPQQEYFVAGMHDAIIAQLAQIAALRVASRTSAAHYGGSGRTVPTIARELKVDALVEGSVLCAGDTVRIHVELIRAAPREQYIWGHTYERDLRDVLALHTEVARAVATEIRVTLTPEERTRLEGSRVINPEAYRHYLIGNFLLGKYTEAGFRQAIEHYQQAIDLDPDQPPVYAAQAVAYIELGSWASSQPPGAVHAAARAAALAALERDSTLAEAHIALARIKQLFEWDWPSAEAEYRRGIELNPRTAYALGLYHNYLMSVGRFEEAAEIGRRIIELDPVAWDGYFHLGWALDHLRRDTEAVVAYEKGLELSPDNPTFLLEMAQFHGERGRLEEAARYAERAESLLGTTGPPAWLGRLGYDYAIANRVSDARRILNQLLNRGEHEYVPPTCPAVIHSALGETDRALDLLEQAYEMRDVIMVWIKTRHQFDPLRATPRFQVLLRRMNFPT